VERLAVANPLSYYDTAIITTIKSFIAFGLVVEQTSRTSKGETWVKMFDTVKHSNINIMNILCP
jgi:hypothetical protein